VKKIIKQTVLIPDPRRLADDLIALLDLMDRTTGVYDRERIRMEVMTHARIVHVSEVLSEVVMTSIDLPDIYVEHVEHRLVKALAEGVLKELGITTTTTEGDPSNG
jgi:hypothetical protein